MTRGIDSPFKFVASLTLSPNSEVSYKSALKEAKRCPSNKKALNKAKSELANFWGKFGFELQQAEQLQKEASFYYSKRSKWVGALYYKSQYSLAEIYYKQGKFNLALAVISNIQSQLQNSPAMDAQYSPNLKALKMLLAIALEGVVDLGSIGYHWHKDLQRLKIYTANQKDMYTGENKRVGTNRNALTRLTRWLNYQNKFPEDNGNHYALNFLDSYLGSIINAPEVDELYIDYALNRLMQKKQNSCDSIFSDFVTKRYQLNSIETNINLVIAESIIARCAQRSNKTKLIDRYVTNLQLFLNTMPSDFAPEVFYELKYFMEALLDNVDWTSVGANDNLLRLLQLRQAVNPTLSSARFDTTLIRNNQARLKYVKREQLKNTYYKLSQPNLPEKDKAHFADIAQQLITIEQDITLNFPQLTKYGASNIYGIKSIQQTLSAKQQLLVLAQTEKRIINLLITNSDVIVTFSMSSKEESIRLIRDIRTQTIEGKAVKEVKKYSQAFSQKIPIITKLKSNKPELLIQADDYFAALPMSLLFDPTNNSWLIEKYMIERHLNLASVVTPLRTQRSFKSRLAIANPDYAKLKQRGKRPNIQSGGESGNKTSEENTLRITTKKRNRDNRGNLIASLIPLYSTLSEAQKMVSTATGIKRILSSDLASKPNVVSHLKQPWDIVIFSTHALFPSNKIKLDYPALALTPNSHKSFDNGLLSSKEIARLNFTHSWIILAACDTSMSIGKRNHLGSLMNSFLLAGSRSVLASHWKVKDAETLTFISALSEQLGNSQTSESKAVWLTKLKFLHKNKHPRKWSSFDIYF